LAKIHDISRYKETPHPEGGVEGHGGKVVA